MTGEHFIEALVPTRHLLGLQYRNVVAFKCTVANLQAQRIKTTIQNIVETEKSEKFQLYILKL